MAGGIRHMEIDHFDPTLRGAARDAYSNLMLATRHCNNMKKNGWPTASQIAAGIRLLNPTKEPDYGRHIFEDSQTHELIGVTPEGSYHIDILDLNHETFMSERRDRAIYFDLCGSAPITLTGQLNTLQSLLGILRRQFERFIPYIPPPPQNA
jgi:hypothetical protein